MMLKELSVRRVLTFASILCSILAIQIIVTSVVNAEQATSLFEQIESGLRADPAFTEDERQMYLYAFRERLAAYGRDILNGERERGAGVLMAIVMEGSLGQVPLERTVDVASAAYIAIRRGSNPEAVEGIALYGFRKKVDTDLIEAWANGYGELLEFGVPAHVAEDLVFQAADHGWDIYTFNTFKWGLVQAAKAGYAPEDFQAYMIGNYLKDGEGPGSMVSSALRYFRSLAGARPKLPKYEGSFIPRKQRTGRGPGVELKGQEEIFPASDGVEKSQKQTDSESNRGGAGGSALGYLLKVEDSYKSYLGVPYAWGGTTRNGMDCSGFVQRVFAEVGISLPRTSWEQWEEGEPIARLAIRKGDLVFFQTPKGRIYHVGIVTSPSEDEFIHASSSKGVSYALLTWRYFDKRFAGARRIVPEGMDSLSGAETYRTFRLFVTAR